MTKLLLLLVIILLFQLTSVQTGRSQENNDWQTADEVFIGKNTRFIDPSSRGDSQWFHFSGSTESEYTFELSANSSDQFELNLYIFTNNALEWVNDSRNPFYPQQVQYNGYTDYYLECFDFPPSLQRPLDIIIQITNLKNQETSSTIGNTTNTTISNSTNDTLFEPILKLLNSYKYEITGVGVLGSSIFVAFVVLDFRHIKKIGKNTSFMSYLRNKFKIRRKDDNTRHIHNPEDALKKIEEIIDNSKD